MKTFFCLFGILFFCSCSIFKPSQKTFIKPIGGEYSFGSANGGGSHGSILIYPINDSSSLFRLDVSRGAPSYNSGAITGEMILNGENTYSFVKDNEGDMMNCNLFFKLDGDTLSISSLEEKFKCGFGYAVYPDGDYVLKDSVIPEFYMNGEGSIFYFKDVNF